MVRNEVMYNLIKTRELIYNEKLTFLKTKGAQVDSFYSNYIVPDGTGLNYKTWAETLIQEQITRFHNYLISQFSRLILSTTNPSSSDFTTLDTTYLCTECQQNLLELLCSSAFPTTPNSFQCLNSLFSSFLFTYCPSQCPCNNSCCFPPENSICSETNPLYSPFSTCPISIYSPDQLLALIDYKQCFSSDLNSKLVSNTDPNSKEIPVASMNDCIIFAFSSSCVDNSTLVLEEIGGTCQALYPNNTKSLNSVFKFEKCKNSFWCPDQVQVTQIGPNSNNKREIDSSTSGIPSSSKNISALKHASGIQVGSGINFGIPFPIWMGIVPSLEEVFLVRLMNVTDNVTPEDFSVSEDSWNSSGQYSDFWNRAAGPLQMYEWFVIIAGCVALAIFCYCIICVVSLIIFLFSRKSNNSDLY